MEAAGRRTCRVCLLDDGRLSLFAGDQDLNLNLKIMACCSVQICEDDGFPSLICLECYAMLNTAFEFKTKCEMSDTKLRNCLRKQELKVEEEDAEEAEYNFAFNEEEFFSDYADNDDDDDKPFPMDVDVKLFESKEEHDLQKKKVSKRKKKWKTTDEKVCSIRKSKRKKKIVIPSTKKCIVSNSIATSLLEGKCVWNGRDWKFEISGKENSNSRSNEIPIIKNEEKEIPHTERKKGKRKLGVKQKTLNLCDTCGKTFKSKYHLKYHIMLKHQETPGTIKCLDPDCKKMFKFNNYMIRHVKRCHSTRREFVCNECGKQYAFISGLKQHMKSHSENLVWKYCNYCSQKYRTQKSVDIHVRSVHTGERPSVCTICESAFFHDDYLKEHMRLHTGETPYKCPICKRGYAQRGNMKSHMKQHRLSELDEATKATMKPNYLKLLRDC